MSFNILSGINDNKKYKNISLGSSNSSLNNSTNISIAVATVYNGKVRIPNSANPSILNVLTPSLTCANDNDYRIVLHAKKIK